MSFTGHMRKMARNNAWSNYRLHQACNGLSDTEFSAKRIGFFPSIQATLNHILAVDLYYIDALTNGGLGPRAFHEFTPHSVIATLAAAQAESDRRLIDFCDGLTETALVSLVRTDRGAQGVFDERCDDVLAHLFQHQIHHRGQAHAMLSGTSVKPPQLDEYFLAYDREAREKDLALLGMADPKDIA